MQPYSGRGPREIVSRGGGIEPVWSPTGREIFYRSIDGRRLMAVAVRTEPSFSTGTPQVLCEGPYPLSSTYWSDYDVWPGGEEFLLVAAGTVTSPELHVVLNWTADVFQRLPGRE